MVPLGIQQTAELGKSVLFLVEANGAIWVGLAAAFAVFGTGMAKKSAPGAVIIMFFGGIAEVCFPYCLMMPITILGPIIGNMFSLFVLTVFDGGAVGPPSPGSVFAFYLMTPKGCMLVNTIAYFGSMLITFAVTGLILKMAKQPNDEMLPVPAISMTKITNNDTDILTNSSKIKLSSINKIAFACDAGMGSSAMGASILKTRLQKNGMFPDISHVAVTNIPIDTDIVVTNVNLAERARNVTKGKIPILTLNNFMDQKEYDHIIKKMKALFDNTNNNIVEANMSKHSNLPIFCEDNIVLNATFKDKTEAITACADLFYSRGYTDAFYKKDMLARDADVSVYLGNGVALPHGLSNSKKRITSSGICFIQVPSGVDFDGQTAYLLIGVAGTNEDHVEILEKISAILCDAENIKRLRNATSKRKIMDVLKFN